MLAGIEAGEGRALASGNIWTDTITGNFTEEKIYAVQTNTIWIAHLSFGLSGSERCRDCDALISLAFSFPCSRSHKQVAPKGYFF